MRSVRQPIEGMEEVVTDVVDPGTGGGRHADVQHVFKSGRQSHPPLWIRNVVGEHLQQPYTGGSHNRLYLWLTVKQPWRRPGGM